MNRRSDGPGTVSREAIPNDQKFVGAQMSGKATKKSNEPRFVGVGIGAHGKVELNPLSQGRDR